MSNKSDPEVGATPVSPPRIGKREGQSGDEQQVNAKKQKRDEVAEEQRNTDEIVSDSEPDKNPECKKDSLSKQKENGKPASASCSSSLELLVDRSEEDEGNMDIDEGDNSEESNEETQEKKMKVLMDAASNAQEFDLKSVENDSFSDSSDDDNKSDDNSSVVIEKPHMPVKCSENSEEGIEEKDSKTPQVNPKMLATQNERNAGSNTIVTRNLSYSVERADLENLFKECGEIVDVRLHTDFEGRFRGFGHVEFATAEAAQKALLLNNTELLRCHIRVALARQKHKHTPNRSFHVNSINLSHSFQRSERTQPMKGSEISGDHEQETEPKILATCKQQSATSKTIYAKNLSYSTEQDDMEFLFKECGEIVDIRLHMDHKGWFKGYGHVEFATTEAAQKALELNNTIYLGRRIGVFIAQEKGEYTSNRSNWSKSFLHSERTKPVKSTESSEYCEEEVEGKASKSLWESSKTLATLKEPNDLSKTIYVRNLSYRVERADMELFFKECGRIVDVHLHMDHKGRLNGFGQVEFATAEAAKKALELHNTELLRRPIGVDLAQEKGEYTYSRSNWSNSFHKCERNQFPPTVYVTGFDSSLPAEEIKASLEEHFGSCGEIERISIPKFHDSGAVKGYAHLEFKDVVSLKKALHLDQNELGGFPLRVEKAKPRHDNHGNGRGRGGGGHQLDGSGYNSRVGWGRSGGAGWHSLHFSDEGTGTNLQLLIQKLNGKNHVEWAQSVKLALNGKGNLGYLTGATQPKITDPSFPRWKSKNSLIIVWLINSMDPSIGKPYLFLPTAKDVW